MEVCGGHTASVLRFGIREMLPQNLRLISGPGCPVCVTPEGIVRQAMEIAGRDDCILATFGDMMRVPSAAGSLEEARAAGALIQVVYSPLDLIEVARRNPSKKVVFLAIGFETTAPATARLLIEAERESMSSIFILSAHKTMPEAMSWLLEQGETTLDGFICPGHVSVIIGGKPYEALSQKHGACCAIAGFEPLDMLLAIHCLVVQKINDTPRVDICYSRSVSWEGNMKAQRLLNTVFDSCPSTWRGLGVIANSGLRLKQRFARFDAVEAFDLSGEDDGTGAECEGGCRCSEILRGLILPSECPFFARECRPESPVGACMVSPEGTCQNHYVFGSAAER